MSLQIMSQKSEVRKRQSLRRARHPSTGFKIFTANLLPINIRNVFPIFFQTDFEMQSKLINFEIQSTLYLFYII